MRCITENERLSNDIKQHHRIRPFFNRFYEVCREKRCTAAIKALDETAGSAARTDLSPLFCAMSLT
jgi:hypothetical protein